MSENGEIYTAGKNFTLPPALTAWTNSTSGGQGRNKQKCYSRGVTTDLLDFAHSEVEFVSAVSAGGSVKFLPAV